MILCGIMICCRKDVIKRLNMYGSHQRKDSSSWRRLDTHPLIVGDAVCSRIECIYACESSYTETRRRYRSPRSNNALLLSGSTNAPTKPTHMHDRYRTSTMAVHIHYDFLQIMELFDIVMM